MTYNTFFSLIISQKLMSVISVIYEKFIMYEDSESVYKKRELISALYRSTLN